MMTQSQKSKRLLAAAIALAMASSVPAISFAQSSDATIRGQAPADTDVVAKNTATGASRRTHSDKDGSYALVGLPPGTYQVDAGPGTQRTVTVTVASTFQLNLSAAAANAAPTANEANAHGFVLQRRDQTTETGAPLGPLRGQMARRKPGLIRWH